MREIFLKMKMAPIQLAKQEKVKELPTLLERLGTLLKEGYTFSDAIYLLLPFHVEQVEQFQESINRKLRNGVNVVEILQCFSLPKHYLIAIKIAEENGDLASALHNVSKQMVFNAEMAKKLQRLLAYPVVLFIFISAIFIAFRTYFLPNIEQIIESRTTSKEQSLDVTKIFLHLPDAIFLFFIVVVLGTLGFIMFVKKRSIEQQLSMILKIPIIRYFYKLQMTRQFARYLGSLLDGGFSIQQALHILQQQQFNQHLSHLCLKIEKRIIYGDSLEQAVTVTAYFFSKFEVFVHHGEKSGYLGKELLIYCELLDDKLQTYIRTAIGITQPLLFLIIATCIIAAYLSVLLPMYSLIEII